MNTSISIVAIVECGTALHQTAGYHKGISMPVSPKFPKLRIGAGYEAGEPIPNFLGWELDKQKFIITWTGRKVETSWGYDNQYLAVYCKGADVTILCVPERDTKWDLQSLLQWADSVDWNCESVTAEWFTLVRNENCEPVAMEHRAISYRSNVASLGRLPWSAFRGLAYEAKVLEVQTNGDCDTVFGTETSLEIGEFSYEHREIIIGQNATYIRVSGDRWEVMPEEWIATVGKVDLNFVATERLVIARTISETVKVAVGYHLTDEEIATTMNNEQLCAAAVRKLYSEIANRLYPNRRNRSSISIGRSILHN